MSRPLSVHHLRRRHAGRLRHRGGLPRRLGPTNVDYLLPGIFVLAIAFGASQTEVAVADDLASGMIDRFRALPVACAAVLAGRTVADAIRNLIVLGLMIGVGPPAVIPLIFTSSIFVPVATRRCCIWPS